MSRHPGAVEKLKSTRPHPHPGELGKESRLLISSVGSSPGRLTLLSVSVHHKLTCAQNSESCGTLPVKGGGGRGAAVPRSPWLVLDQGEQTESSSRNALGPLQCYPLSSSPGQPCLLTARVPAAKINVH